MVPVKAIGERLSLSTVDIFVQSLNITTPSSLVIHQNTNISQVHPHEPMTLSLLGERRTRKNQKTVFGFSSVHFLRFSSHSCSSASLSPHLHSYRNSSSFWSEYQGTRHWFIVYIYLILWQIDHWNRSLMMVQVHTLWCGSPNQSQTGPVFSHYNRSKMIQSLHGVLVHRHSRGGLRGLVFESIKLYEPGFILPKAESWSKLSAANGLKMERTDAGAAENCDRCNYLIFGVHFHT